MSNFCKNPHFQKQPLLASQSSTGQRQTSKCLTGAERSARGWPLPLPFISLIYSVTQLSKRGLYANSHQPALCRKQLEENAHYLVSLVYIASVLFLNLFSSILSIWPHVKWVVHPWRRTRQWSRLEIHNQGQRTAKQQRMTCDISQSIHSLNDILWKNESKQNIHSTFINWYYILQACDWPNVPGAT